MNVKSEPYADIVKTAAALVERDTTVTRYGEVPTSGFCVGGACVGWRVSADANYIAIIEAVANWIQAQPSNVVYFGSWRDGGFVYFDGVDIIESEADALALARERGEVAVYDLVAGVCVPTIGLAAAA